MIIFRLMLLLYWFVWPLWWCRIICRWFWDTIFSEIVILKLLKMYGNKNFCPLTESPNTFIFSIPMFFTIPGNPTSDHSDKPLCDMGCTWTRWRWVVDDGEKGHSANKRDNERVWWANWPSKSPPKLSTIAGQLGAITLAHFSDPRHLSLIRLYDDQMITWLADKTVDSITGV